MQNLFIVVMTEPGLGEGHDVHVSRYYEVSNRQTFIYNGAAVQDNIMIIFVDCSLLKAG